MKLVILEPLGIPMSELEDMAKRTLKDTIDITIYDNRKEDIPTLIERSRDADIVVLSNFKYPKEVISSCPKLKMICVAFTGVDHVDIEYCREKGITVCNCAGYSTSAVADLVFGMVISLSRNIIACDKTIRKGGTKDGLIGFELEGKNFGIIGAGAIGQRTAQIANAFGCNVYAYSRTIRNIENVKFIDLDTLLSTCDIVSLHVPLNDSTRGMISKEKLELMKPTSILINTARGPVVDNTALAEALNNGTIAAAGVDVFETEPPIADNHPLLTAKNILLTPHIAFASQQAFEKRAVIVFDNIVSYLNGNPINVII